MTTGLEIFGLWYLIGLCASAVGLEALRAWTKEDITIGYLLALMGPANWSGVVGSVLLRKP